MSRVRVILGAALAAAVALPLSAARARAVPIFAQRYGFSCTQCHTAVPELNAFGDHFRRAGFTVPGLRRRPEVPLALRFQETYVKDLLPSQTRRFNALAVAVSTASFGRDRSYSYFARYLFGSQGAPGSLYYAYVQRVDERGDLVRGGLFQLPLIANPTQRLDTLTSHGAYTYTVGHSDASFATPRWGVLAGRRDDTVDVEIALSLDEYHGAAYGAPAPPSEFTQRFARPEVFFTAGVAARPGLTVGGLLMSGAREITSRITHAAFTDDYTREGVQAKWASRRFEVVGQQLWGRDGNADGFGSALESSGGYLMLKYRPAARAYAGLRYDAFANPIAQRDFVVYGVFAPTIHARAVVEDLLPIGTAGTGRTLRAQLLFALPFERASAAGP